MGATDALLARLTAEIEERTQFMNGIVESAQSDDRDLTENEMGSLARNRDRIQELDAQVGPVGDFLRIAHDSRQRTAEITRQFEEARNPEIRPGGPVEYRSAGAYVLDYWRAGLGVDDARERMDLFQRAAAHQTSGDNPGLLPEQILGPVVNFVDEARPFINALGPRQLPSGSWSRPQITQHTQIGVQAGEKTELASRKMTIGKVPVTARTYGGYVNVSRQDADWTQPQIMDLIINDLAGQYAVETENAAVDNLTAAATTGPTIATGTPTAAAIAGALWTAAGSVFNATKGAGRVIAACGADLLGLFGPLFPPVNPQNAQSSGFSAGAFGTGAVGNVAGIPIYVSAGMAANTMLVLSTAAAEIYEDRVGALQVVEPSVLGIQVAYAGYFTELALLPAGIIKVIKTP